VTEAGGSRVLEDGALEPEYGETRYEMRRDREWLTLAVASLLGLGGVACVDQEASLAIRGVVEHTGSETSEEVECPDGMGGMTSRTKPVLNCQKSVEAGSAEDFLTRISIDISDFQGGTGGQIGPSQGGLSGDDFCELDRQTYISRRFRDRSMVLTLDTQNRLQDSREVGAEGQGGGQGGFEGLELNQNDINIEQLKIRYPDAPAEALERTVDLSLLAESGGGGAALEFELIDGSDISALERVHQSLANSPEEVVTVIARFRVSGETRGGNEVESNRFAFPIRLCARGCGTTPECDFQSEAGGGGG